MAKRTVLCARLSLAARSKVLQCVLLGLVVVAMLGAGESRSNRLGHEMICTCGCTQIMMECNHVNCPVSPVMLSELRGQLAGGGGDTAVLNWFVAKYGAIVLAAPMRGGFDTVAWIMPIAVFVLATFGTAAVVWAWRRRGLRLAQASQPYPGGGVFDFDPRGLYRGVPGSADAELRERIRRETEYR